MYICYRGSVSLRLKVDAMSVNIHVWCIARRLYRITIIVIDRSNITNTHEIDPQIRYKGNVLRLVARHEVYDLA